MLLSQILFLRSRSQAMSFRLSDLGPRNDQSYRLRTDKDRAARDTLLASNTFVRYVQVWMLHHTISAPIKTQAKVWPEVFKQAVKTASGLLWCVCFATWFTLKLSYAETLTPDCYVYLLAMHSNCNFLLARRCLEFWQAWRLLSSTNGGMLPLRRRYKQEQWDLVLAIYVTVHLQWCMVVRILRGSVVDHWKPFIFLIDLLICALQFLNFRHIFYRRGFPGNTMRYEYALEKLDII